MKAAYADPPYFGLAAKFYGDRHPDAADYDRIETHAALIERLGEYDAWALSLHSPSLKHILPLCPEDVRVGAWVKPMCSFKPGVNPGYSWEPVIFRGGRKRARDEMTVRDYVSANMAIGQELRGSKPNRFAYWIFDLLGLAADDDFHDLFPGSGAIGRVWDAWRRQTALLGGAA